MLTKREMHSRIEAAEKKTADAESRYARQSNRLKALVRVENAAIGLLNTKSPDEAALAHLELVNALEEADPHRYHP